MNCFCDGSGEGDCPECGGPDEEHGYGHIATCVCEAGNKKLKELLEKDVSS